MPAAHSAVLPALAAVTVAAAAVSFTSSGSAVAPAGAPIPALMAAEPAPHVGLLLRVPVAGATGVHDWDFEVVARDGDRWLLQRALRRGPGRPALQWSAWLDGQRGFLPVDLRFSLDDDEQWALRLLD